MHAILLSVDFQTFLFPYKVLNGFRLQIFLRDLMCSAYTGPANEVGWTPWKNLLQLRGFPARIQGLLMSHVLLQRETGPRGETVTALPRSAAGSGGNTTAKDGTT